MSTVEGKLSSKVAKWARDHGIYETKLSSGQGWPDRLFIFPNGRICFVEFKAPGKRPSERQQRIIDSLLRRKIATFVISDYDLIIEIFKEIL